MFATDELLSTGHQSDDGAWKFWARQSVLKLKILRQSLYIEKNYRNINFGFGYDVISRHLTLVP